MVKSRDGVVLKKRMQVFFYVPRTSNVSSGVVEDLHAYGPTVNISGSCLLFHRDAVWTDENKAVADGYPEHIYPRPKKAVTNKIANPELVEV